MQLYPLTLLSAARDLQAHILQNSEIGDRLARLNGMAANAVTRFSQDVDGCDGAPKLEAIGYDVMQVLISSGRE